MQLRAQFADLLGAVHPGVALPAPGDAHSSTAVRGAFGELSWCLLDDTLDVAPHAELVCTAMGRSAAW